MYFFLLVRLAVATTIDQCKDHRVHVQGTGPIALVSLMNAWGEKYALFRQEHGFNVLISYNDTSSYKALPSSKQQRLWFTASHANNRSNVGPGSFAFPYLVRALVVIFNIPNVEKLRISLHTLADIYSGNVTAWDDPRIQKFNDHVELPSRRILPVARQENGETTTVLFTQFLCDVSASWKAKYGFFNGPSFVNDTCCDSTTWPQSVIRYFALNVVGVVGVVSSILDTIGYITVPSITQYANFITVATLLDDNGSAAFEPTMDAQQRVMVNYLSRPENAQPSNVIMMSKEDASTNGAYPMTSITYMSINVSTDDPRADCCAVMELLGFIDWMMDNSTVDFLINQSYVPILPDMADRITDYILRNVTCNGQSMYDQYLISLQPPPPPLQIWLIAFLAIGFAFLIVTVVYAYTYNLRKRRADVNQWLIPNGRIRFGDAGDQRRTDQREGRLSARSLVWRPWSSPKSEVKYVGECNEAVSIDSSSDALTSGLGSGRTATAVSLHTAPGEAHHPTIGHLKDLSMVGELDGNLVSIVKLNLSRWPPINWSTKTKRLMADLKLWSAHKNLATIMGVVCTPAGAQYVIGEHCSKGTLHYVLRTCRYRLTDTIRGFLSLDVARALTYLHDRNLAVSRLNSLTCYMDSSWSVKVSEWYIAPLCLEELISGRGCSLRALLGVLYNPEELLEEEHLIRLLYVDPAILSVRKASDVNAVVQNLDTKTGRAVHLAKYKNADAYSFGYLLAEIYSGHLPYTVEAEMHDFSYQDHLKQKFLFGAAPRIPAVPPAPKSIVNIIERCLLADAKSRPSFSRIYKMLVDANAGVVAKRSKDGVGSKGIVDAMMETMDSYAQTLEEKVEERTTELRTLTKRMRGLLNEVLPPPVAEKLFTGQSVLPEFFECVTIYFSDIVGFTSISAQSTPFQVMGLLNDLWLCFDSVIDKFDVYKVDTIGDAYMVCSGLPNRNGMMHCRNICQLSLALLDRCTRFKIHHLPGQQLRIRIGVNSGPVTAGVVGSKMPQYCVFGDAVNTAARMESTSIPNKIQVSHNTFELLNAHYPDEFSPQYRGEIEVKGKGTMKTYWLMKTSVNGMFKNFCH